jgi:hypothetical protein
MHIASVAKTATLNSASIMFPSIESRLPFEGLICRDLEIFPVVGSASDDHHSLVLLIGGLLVASRLVTVVTAISQDRCLAASCTVVVPGGAMTTYLL